MKLQARLDGIREDFEKKAPASVLEIMHGVTADLIDSGIASRATGEGHGAPEFDLNDSAGTLTKLGGILSRGPLVLNFFRGHW